MLNLNMSRRRRRCTAGPMTVRRGRGRRPDRREAAINGKNYIVRIQQSDSMSMCLTFHDSWKNKIEIEDLRPCVTIVELLDQR